MSTATTASPTAAPHPADPAATAQHPTDPTIPGLAGFVEFLETGHLPADLFAPDVFGDLSTPLWRVQATSAGGLVALRRDGHPCPGRVTVEQAERTTSGFAVFLSERWADAGGEWYCREGFLATLRDGRITELRIMCTGDWDSELQARHAREVTLARP